VVDPELLQLSETSKKSTRSSEKGEKINAARYVQTLNKFRRALREKHQKKGTVTLQHDNARPHTALLTLQTVRKNDWEVLSHSPYSPDLAHSDYHLFGPLEYHLKGYHYETDDASRKPCEAGCEELERTSTAETCLRFYSAGRNAQIGMEIS
jgi:transposase